MRSTREELAAGTALARSHGVTELPALIAGDEVAQGLAAVTAAARSME
jgi:hypothetical protein